MSLSDGFSWSHRDWVFTGYSLAGITTSVFCKTASVCFDVGQGLPFQLPARTIAITHAHLDHASGIPWLISQKNMNSQDNTLFLVPEHLYEPIQQILKIWQGVDEHQYKYRMRILRPGESVDLDKGLALRAFATPHRVPSQGYLLLQKKKRLKKEFEGATREAILRAKEQGVDPNEELTEPAVAFTGDTKIEFWESDPDVLRAKILFVEATFWDDAKPIDHARKWGHIHLDEVIELLPKITSEKIVLIHASVRYSTRMLESILEKKLPRAERERVVIFPRPI